MRKNSIKNTRINGEVQKELSNIIRNEIKDPRIGMMTSVTAAEVAPDLKTCKVYISVFGDDEAKKETIRGLKSAEGFIRRMLAKTINLRNTPELTFVLDESIEYGVTMSKLIDEVTHKEDKKDEENEENYRAWRKAGKPDVVIGMVDFSELYPDQTVTESDYVLVAEIPYTFIWKASYFYGYVPIYVRKTIAEEKDIPILYDPQLYGSMDSIFERTK